MAGEDGFLIRSGGGAWESPSLTGYTDEAALQQILAEHPELLPGVDEPAVACTEFESGVGPADVVVITDDGRLVLVECKLARNRQVRREVIGQVLDYSSRSGRCRSRTSRPGGRRERGSLRSRRSVWTPPPCAQGCRALCVTDRSPWC